MLIALAIGIVAFGIKKYVYDGDIDTDYEALLDQLECNCYNGSDYDCERLDDLLDELGYNEYFYDM